MSYSLLKYAADADESDLKDRAKAMKVLGWIFVVATIVFILVTFFLRNQIQSVTVHHGQERTGEERRDVHVHGLVQLVCLCALVCVSVR